MSAGKSDAQDDRAKKSLAGLAASLGGDDEEKAFLKGAPPPAEGSAWDKTTRELKKNWWMWATVAFVVFLLGSLYIFKDSIYSSDTHGLPVIAVKDDVAESCETQCTEKLESMKKEENANLEGAKGKEVYDTCLSKCMSEEAKDIVEERAKWKKEEEEAEKEEQEEAKEEEKEAKKSSAKKKAKKAKEAEEEEEEGEDGGNRRLFRKLRLLL